MQQPSATYAPPANKLPHATFAHAMKPSRHSRFSSAGSMYQKPMTQQVGLTHDEAHKALGGKAGCIFKKSSLEGLWCDWKVAGTARQDRHLRECDAIAAPRFPVHRDLHSPSKGARIVPSTGKRFLYQEQSGIGKFHLAHVPVNMAKGAVNIKPSRHSRFSSVGALYVESKTFGADAFYTTQAFGARAQPRAPLAKVGNGAPRFATFGNYMSNKQ
jgi:hypothetical protein